MSGAATHTTGPWTWRLEPQARGPVGKGVMRHVALGAPHPGNPLLSTGVITPNWSVVDGDVWQAWISVSEANARLIAAAPCLLKALQSLIPQAMTGNPTHAAQVEFWTSEKAAGRGEADDVLFALDAIARATAQQPDSTR